MDSLEFIKIRNYQECSKYLICRCKEIKDVEIINIFSKKDFIKFIQSELDPKIKYDEEILNYFFDRTYSILKLFKKENYSFEWEQSYYGDEIFKCLFKNQEKIYNFKMFFQNYYNDLKSLTEFLLNEEYGYVLEKLINKDYSICKIDVQYIRTNNEYIKLIEENDINYEINLNIPIIVVYKENEYCYSIIDGNHRFKIYSKDKSKQKIKVIKVE